MAIASYRREDLDASPMLVFYEMTRACDLKCQHCRADAQTDCHPEELSTSRARRLIEELAGFPRPPLLVLTGGDPLKRKDVFELTEHAIRAGLEVAMTPSATPLVTSSAVQRLKQVGLHRLAVSLDGADARTHDGFRGVPGSYDRTLQIISDARECGLPVQINTTVSRANVAQLDAIAEMLATLGITLWSVFFLVPTGRATAQQRLDADAVETVFQKLWGKSRAMPYAIKTTEAPHYRRFLIQQWKSMRAGERPPQGPVGTNDGKGVMFISHIGEIYPSGFLPICCGRFPFDSVRRVYQEAALFRALRDPDRLDGKCGACEFRNICGGSRARSYALTGDPLGAEPDCAYIPAGWGG